jgi:RNA polymerase sigma factor (sigma-70 family)
MNTQTDSDDFCTALVNQLATLPLSIAQSTMQQGDKGSRISHERMMPNERAMDAPTTNALPSDHTLLQACRDGDTQGWSRLLEKYERLVFSIPLNYGLSSDDAADITQVVFASLLQSLDDLRDDSNLGGWLSTVARRQSWRLIARRRREWLDPFDEEEVQGLIPQSTSNIERWEVIEWLNFGLNQLDERCRRLLLTLYFDPQEHSYADIAAMLEMAEGSIGPIRARCLQRLRKFMEASD